MSVYSKPLSLQCITVSNVVTNDLQNSPDVEMDSKTREFTNTIVKQRWDALKREAPQDFKKIMQDIEDEVFCSEATDALFLHNEYICISSLQWDSEAEDRNRLVEAKVNLLFQKLAQKIGTEPLFGAMIPVDLLSYECVQPELDKALLALWAKISATILVPELTDVEEIRNWLKDPENQARLDRVIELRIPSKGMKVIPPEITYCKNLAYLSLEFNQISIIPDFISELKNLHQIDLAYNQISTIPDSLSTLPRLDQLILNNNQISIIPDSLSTLPKLRYLYLQNNCILTIPDSFSMLKQLRVLNLEHNRIYRIPNSISTMQDLSHLQLSHNQISNLPVSIAELKELELLGLNWNKISSLPDCIFDLPKLNSLQLNGNELLVDYHLPSHREEFRNYKPSHLSDLVEFRNYKCLSHFSRLVQLLANQNPDSKMIEHTFYQLPQHIQVLIAERVYMVHCDLGKRIPYICHENHCFDDMTILRQAVRKAISARFDQLTPGQKNEVYMKITELAQPETSDAQWGKQHAFDHVLRLVDAMDLPLIFGP